MANGDVVIAVPVGKQAVEEVPTPRSQVIALNAGTPRAEFFVEASASSEVVGVRIGINSIDDVGAANNFVGPKFGALICLDSDESMLLDVDAYAVYLMALQSGATNPSPTSGYIGAANIFEAAQANINVTNIMQRLDGWGANVRKVRVKMSKSWGSGRYALVRVEGYA